MTVTPLSIPFTKAAPVEADDPVADFISALIHSGEYTPGRHGITDEAIRRHRKVHAYSMEHQKATGAAPLPELVARKFPEFPLVSDMPVEWAASQLRDEHLRVQMSYLLSKASRELIDGDPRAAYLTMTEEMRGIRPTESRGVNAFDPALILEPDPTPVPVGIRSLMDLTGGIQPGEFWFVGARPGRGKSWDLLKHAIAASDAGINVVLFSMEMSAKEVSKRLLAMLHGWDRVLTWSDQAKLEAANARNAEHGEIIVKDPSAVRCDVLAIEAAAQPNTLILVDHIGLMRSVSGLRSSEDFKVASTISNDLKEIAGRHKVPVLAASQLNRRSESNKAPSLTDLAQTDAAGQDADLVYSISANPGSRVQQNTVVKNRRGPAGSRWYTDFRPHLPAFEEISKAKARTILENESGGLDLLS